MNFGGRTIQIASSTIGPQKMRDKGGNREEVLGNDTEPSGSLSLGLEVGRRKRTFTMFVRSMFPHVEFRGSLFL